jgi:hypothetical protein
MLERMTAEARNLWVVSSGSPLGFPRQGDD